MVRVCLGCKELFEADYPWRRVCLPCKEEWRRWLVQRLQLMCRPGQDPLKRLYSWALDRGR
jgi:hypothetical protein